MCDRGSMRKLCPTLLLLLLLALVTGELTPCERIIKPELLSRLENVGKRTFAAYLENFSKLLASYYDSQLHYYFRDVVPMLAPNTNSDGTPNTSVDQSFAQVFKKDSEPDSCKLPSTRRSTRLLCSKDAVSTASVKYPESAPPALSTRSTRKSSKRSASYAVEKLNIDQMFNFLSLWRVLLICTIALDMSPLNWPQEHTNLKIVLNLTLHGCLTLHQDL